jgi:hypothetical protein
MSTRGSITLGELRGKLDMLEVACKASFAAARRGHRRRRLCINKIQGEKSDERRPDSHAVKAGTFRAPGNRLQRLRHRSQDETAHPLRQFERGLEDRRGHGDLGIVKIPVGQIKDLIVSPRHFQPDPTFNRSDADYDNPITTVAS